MPSIRSSELTKEHIKLLTLVSEGYEGKDLSRILFCHNSTVKRLMSDIFEKLGANNRAHAVGIAYRTGKLT